MNRKILSSYPRVKSAAGLFAIAALLINLTACGEQSTSTAKASPSTASIVGKTLKDSNTTDLKNAKLVGDEVINTTYGKIELQHTFT
jgi:hypothetical protein